MNELEGLLSEPALSDERIERIRRRGRHLLSHPRSGTARREEVLIVTVFSVAMLVWAVASVMVPTV